jgi:predicted metal-dependent HD superfamily phosphohydrolase
MTDFFRVGNHDLAFLRSQWEDLLSSYTSDTAIKAGSFQVLKEKYSEKSRFYHNLSHVKALLNLSESLNNKIREHNAIRFAIWFHDVIYDTKRSDNEEESAGLASETMAKLHVNLETINFVRELILATKDHSGENLPDDARLFLDMDLAILGTSEDVYKEYSKAIREEYFWVHESMYRTGRENVLRSFIQRERIYLTDEMKATHEEQARENINNEIKSLKA